MLHKTLLITLTAAVTLLSGCVAAPLVVGAGAGAGAVALSDDRRPQAQIAQDDASTSRIQELLDQQKLADSPNRIRYTVYNGVVLLVGQVANDNIRALAHQAAQSAPGVKNVINELTVGPALSTTQIAEDSYLSSKVRTKLATTRDFKSKHLTIVVENGSVYLMGLMTREEQRIAVAVTRDVDGVKRVVRIMENWGV
ncbi:MAG: BON domain-containing protein [Thiotrichales bacterium]|jgi:osmotically-inducible protein OsmY|nr:BON domain-containing protein [Thiotrichales bacterium]